MKKILCILYTHTHTHTHTHTQCTQSVGVCIANYLNGMVKIQILPNLDKQLVLLVQDKSVLVVQDTLWKNRKRYCVYYMTRKRYDMKNTVYPVHTYTHTYTHTHTHTRTHTHTHIHSIHKVLVSALPSKYLNGMVKILILPNLLVLLVQDKQLVLLGQDKLWENRKRYRVYTVNSGV